ncbi:uncharacterized protein TNCV_3011431 [Trichonephila clavipes]|nr:uncharacterized protein TNCV_3011431 [Trichonephila clavipes]
MIMGGCGSYPGKRQLSSNMAAYRTFRQRLHRLQTSSSFSSTMQDLLEKYMSGRIIKHQLFYRITRYFMKQQDKSVKAYNIHWCGKIKDEVEKLAYQLNEEAERTERPIRRLSKVMYGSTCADMQVDVMMECLSSIKHVVGVRSVFLAKRLHAV